MGGPLWIITFWLPLWSWKSQGKTSELVCLQGPEPYFPFIHFKEDDKKCQWNQWNNNGTRMRKRFTPLIQRDPISLLPGSLLTRALILLCSTSQGLIFSSIKSKQNTGRSKWQFWMLSAAKTVEIQDNHICNRRGTAVIWISLLLIW